MERRTGSGRPSGTDGSDFSYRMVVDSRYTRVAKGKSRLGGLLVTQVVVQMVGLLFIALSMSKKKTLDDTLTVSSSAIGFISLLIGELGRKWSRISLLRIYLAASSIGILLQLFCAFSSEPTSVVIFNTSGWEANKSKLIETFVLLIGVVVQIFAVSTVSSLIGNMSPPKKAS